jgi:hypothetical protein
VAHKIQTMVIDDLDGLDADGTARSGLPGTEHDNGPNAAAARRPCGMSRRPVSVPPGGPAVQPGGPLAAAQDARDGLNAVQVREWANAQGTEVKDRCTGAAELAARFSTATGTQLASVPD